VERKKCQYGLRIEAPIKAPREVGYGEVVSPSLSDYGIWGIVVSSPSGVRGRAPGENDFGAF